MVLWQFVISACYRYVDMVPASSLLADPSSITLVAFSLTYSVNSYVYFTLLKPSFAAPLNLSSSAFCTSNDTSWPSKPWTICLGIL